MKAVCHREGLLSGCQLASVAVAARDVKPILRNIKATVEEDRCMLQATDLEVGIRLELRGIHAEKPGEAILPTGRILSILRESTDDELVLETNTEACFLRGKFNEYEMPAEDPSLFPEFPAFTDDKYHEIPAEKLREMIRRTQFAAASSEHTKYATTGILWELDEGKIRLVATDGRRLALSDGEAEAHGGHGTKGQTPVVPTKAMTLLERTLQGGEEKVRVCLRPNEILIKTDRATIYSRLVEGRFPNYKQVLPAKNNFKIPLVVGPFQTAVRQAAIMTDEESKRVIFKFGGGKMTLQARGTETGRSHVEMPLDYDGKAAEISFDPKFLLDMLKVLEPETKLVLELVDANSPALFRHESGDYLYVLVPLVAKE